jgi:type II secretory pathway pseudopilin PulG
MINPMPRTTQAGSGRRGFTVTELLVVIDVIALLVGLLFPVFAKVRAQARTTKCLNNQRQITLANAAYAASNKGKYVSPRTDNGGQTYPNNALCSNTTVYPNGWHCWVRAQAPNITGTFEKPEALEKGALFPYIGNIQTYVSPDEPTNPHAMVASSANTRIRSYSFNALLGVSRIDELSSYDNVFTALGVPLQKFATQSVGQISQPSRTMSTIVEDDSVAWNNQGWVIEPIVAKWVDWPATWRPDAIALSYVDGSVESYVLKNKNLPLAFETFGHNYVQPADAPAGFATDWKYFRDRLLPGVIPNSTYEFSN